MALYGGMKDIERFFVAGMVHDVGQLLMYKLAPQEMGEALRLSFQQRIPVQKAEKQIFGFDHSDVAERLFSRWGLPERLSEIVVHHHSPLASSMPKEAAILSLADAFTVALEYGHNGQWYFGGFQKGAWEASSLAISHIPVIVAQAQRQLDDIFSIFLE